MTDEIGDRRGEATWRKVTGLVSGRARTQAKSHCNDTNKTRLGCTVLKILWGQPGICYTHFVRLDRNPKPRVEHEVIEPVSGGNCFGKVGGLPEPLTR